MIEVNPHKRTHTLEAVDEVGMLPPRYRPRDRMVPLEADRSNRSCLDTIPGVGSPDFQESMPWTYYVAWWNVENLFDEENSPRRTEKLARVLGASILGWTPALRDRKI